MKILEEYPPNYQAIARRFPEVVNRKAVFTFGSLLYNPTGFYVSKDLMAHEQTHEKQQKNYPGGVMAWWADYLADDTFRLSQEVEAYRVQYRTYKLLVKDRNKQAVFLHHIAMDLSSPLYGGLIQLGEAKKKISA